MTELTLLISRKEIAQKVKDLANQINRDYQGKAPVLVGILKGTFVFLADLVRHLNLPVEIDFVQISSYVGMETTGKIKIVKKLGIPVKGRDVLVIEDIVDTGLTLSFLLNYIKRKKPASLKTCALFDKPERRRIPIPIDYLGFTVPNKFLVGYGLDWNEKFRHLPDLWILEKE